MRRSRAFERLQRKRAIRRKKRIALIRYGKDIYNGCDGKYNKGHIGCGRSLCKPGKRFHRPSWSEMKEVERYRQDLKDFWKEEENTQGGKNERSGV